ncbi:MAG TPA: methionyl-tRNA formyltransferase [Xanthomonadales bacterium]|nr:methionyl-tRNA formyltransferase [Xanthomonadales bacterium]
MRLVFAGTPHFALPTLEAVLASGNELKAVYTQPDRPAGRGRQLAESPVKQRALAAGIPVRQPESLRFAPEQNALADLEPDLMIVIAYGLILPKKVLAIPKHGCWNLHASLLPRWRGAAPIARALMAGDTETGVCLMQMEAGLDTGPVLLSLPTPIAADDDAASLHDRLAALSAQLTKDGLALLRAGLKPVAQAQPAQGATYAQKLEKAEALLDPALPARTLERRVRALYPWPVAEIELAGERLRVHGATLGAAHTDAPPGTVVGAGRDGIDVATGEGVLRLLKVQRAGGRAIAAGDYVNARPELRATAGA